MPATSQARAGSSRTGGTADNQPVPRSELVDGREHHATARLFQQPAQMLAPAGLHRRPGEAVRAALELLGECDALSVDAMSTIHATQWLQPTRN